MIFMDVQYPFAKGRDSIRLVSSPSDEPLFAHGGGQVLPIFLAKGPGVPGRKQIWGGPRFLG
jgi:hypothetical protein